MKDESSVIIIRNAAPDPLGAVQGLTSIQSYFDPKDTRDRLVAAIEAKGMTVFARIDYAAVPQKSD